MKIKRNGSAAWSGGIKDGKGEISTESGALKSYPYGFASRFEGQKGRSLGNTSAPRGVMHNRGESPHEEAVLTASRSESWTHGGNEMS